MNSSEHLWRTTFAAGIEATWPARCRDKPALTFPEWGERYLSNADGSRFEFRPYQRQPALDLFDERLQYIALRWFSGAGKTYLLASALCYGAHQLGLQMATMMPAELQAKEWLRDEFEPMVDATGVMTRIGFRKRGDQALCKRWLNGAQLRVLGSNSSGELRRLQVDLMMADEIDAYKQDAVDEGDKLAQFWKRGRGRQRQFHWASSYPSVRGASRIDTLLEASDYCKWTVACTHCSTPFVLHTDQIQMPGDDPLKAIIECPSCARAITDPQRREMSLAGRYLDSAGKEATSSLGKNHCGRRGYFVGCLAHVGDHGAAYPSYLVEVASEMQRIASSENKEKARRVFVNTMDAESFRPMGSAKPEPDAMLECREDYDPRVALPEGVLLLTIGGDVQGDRLEFEVVGHGEDGQTWGCGYKIVRGYTDRPETWAKADGFLRTVYTHPLYGRMMPAMTLIDSQYRQKEVLQFTRGKASRGIYACYGSANPNKPAVSKRKTVGNPPTPAYEIGTNAIKDVVYQSFSVNPGDYNYCHYPRVDEYDGMYFSQLLAEEWEMKDGVKVFTNPQKLRNEALDVRVYALAGRIILRPNFAKLKETLEGRQQPAKPDPKPGLAIPQPARPPRRWL